MLCPSDLLSLAHNIINTRYNYFASRTPSPAPRTCSSVTILPSQISCNEYTQISPVLIANGESEEDFGAAIYVSENELDMGCEVVEVLKGDCFHMEPEVNNEIQELLESNREIDRDDEEDRGDEDDQDDQKDQEDQEDHHDHDMPGIYKAVDVTDCKSPGEINECPAENLDRAVDNICACKYGPVDTRNPKEFHAIFRMLQTAFSPQITLDYTTFEEYIHRQPFEADPGPRPKPVYDFDLDSLACSKPVYPFRKDPRLLFKPSSQTTKALPSKSRKRGQKQFNVTLHFPEFKEFIEVILLSGRSKEYQLPVFSNLVPLRKLIKVPEYHAQESLTSNDVEVINSESVTIKRYDCRLTLAQMAIVLGLQDYKVTLMQYIDGAIFQMLDQICGFRVGRVGWSRGSSLKKRQEMVLMVTKFLRIYFPILTPELVELIIKRGFYCRMQQYLKKRRLERSGRNRRRS